jgi:hypothetical protein
MKDLNDRRGAEPVKKRGLGVEAKNAHTISNAFDHLHDPEHKYRTRRDNESLRKGRLAMLLHNDLDSRSHRKLLENYTSYDYPYIPGRLGLNRPRKNVPELRLEVKRASVTRDFSLDRQRSSDPSYLAPFGLPALHACEDTDHIGRNPVDKTKTSMPPRPQQGNCLLSLPCPCPPCKDRPPNQRSWCLFHPKGPLLDHFCVSNLIPPNGIANAGHLYAVHEWEKIITKWDRIQRINKQIPNELCLDETILEIKQGGAWDSVSQECTFVARTSTHISVLNVSVRKAFLDGDKKYCRKEDTCWGNYVVEESRRIDLRSLSMSFPSYRPVSLACHPKYGNALTDARFAFVCHSERGERNCIHHGVAGGAQPSVHHSIPCLKYISFIDFTSTQPMCLWSAAASYVRPALAVDLQFNRPTLGLGTSLYTVDLRSNSATFQWSPSAQEMVTEGVHSISGIMTDWQRDNTVWVTSTSAGKTWEIDGRMPCRAVNSWSLTSSCEDSAITFAQKGLYGEGSLLTKTRQSEHSGWVDTAPVLNVGTTPGAFGFHVFQRPETKPRFQADSLEVIATPNVEFTDKTSIATSSVFALPDVSDEVYTCGISSFRIPFSHFVCESDNHLMDFANEDSNVLCTLTMTNKGDTYCHTLLESNKKIDDCRPVPDLPVGIKVVRIAQELNGTTKELEHKRWKPTGGMNLKLYLTNQYPMPWNVMTPHEQNSRKKRMITIRKRKQLEKPHHHPSLRVGSEVPVYKTNPVHSGITLSAEPYATDQIGEKPVAIPLSLAEQSRKTMTFYQSKDLNERTGERGTGKESDLSARVIQNASELWDEMDSGSDDEGFLSPRI